MFLRDASFWSQTYPKLIDPVAVCTHTKRQGEPVNTSRSKAVHTSKMTFLDGISDRAAETDFQCN